MIKPELAQNNKYWIPRHRYYELKHFCLQYPIWKKAYESLDSLSKSPTRLSIFSINKGDPVYRCFESREHFYDLLKMVESACDETDESLSRYLLRAVTNGYTYEYLKMNYNIPCCREVYYESYRRFFWILSKKRN